MKSPITGKEMVLRKEFRLIKINSGMQVRLFKFYKCEESGEQFTTTELDELNLKIK